MLVRSLVNFLTTCLLALGVAGYSYAVDLDASIYGKLNLSYDFLDLGVNDWHSNAPPLG